MMYALYLTTECISYPRNDYGYWRGKTYKVGGETFPITDLELTYLTKRYSSKKRADSMGEKLRERCPYVESWVVKELQ